ncbi:hypothetical protein C2845_PM02G14270 [Panicum miliaceum]|uniref:BED-type domain-containing protein n=1 Tax=Panicum miliaceum TaxID=4540 RepID=A0A3L6SD46_PANMI|nr:hypothetical protein C2845_PM02G14270 [Panicum miliaceum]
MRRQEMQHHGRKQHVRSCFLYGSSLFLFGTELNDGNNENVWNHGTRLNGQGFKCGYCGMTNKGGGATRLRDHLGEVRACNSVPRVVRDTMRELRKLSMEKKREKEQRKLRLERDLMQGVHGGDEVIDLASDEEDQARMEIRNSLRNTNISHAIERRSVSGKSVRVLLAKGVSTAYFDKDLARSKASVQPKIDTTILEGSREKLGQAWAKWFHANNIAGLKADCPYFRNAIKLTQQLGSMGYIPTSREIDGEFL